MASPPTDPNAPHYWAHPHPYCGFSGNTLGSPDGYGWHCEQMPPEPWPYSTDIPPEQLGPQWTTYRYTLDDLAARTTHGISQVGEQAARIALGRWKVPWFPIGLGSVTWTVLQGQEPRMSVDLWRVSVHANLGVGEESINCFHFDDQAGPPRTIDAAGAQQVGIEFAAAWTDFIQGVGNTPNGGAPIASLFPAEMQWNEVRVARVQLVAGAPKPTYLVDTQYVPFTTPADVKGLGTQALPYEVAMCLSLGTGMRGGRNRGRTYLGPLSSLMLGPAGVFAASGINVLAFGFKAAIVDGLAGNPSPLQLVIGSGKYGSARAVSEVRVGQVPDSQRRRRRSMPENYQTIL